MHNTTLKITLSLSSRLTAIDFNKSQVKIKLKLKVTGRRLHKTSYRYHKLCKYFQNFIDDTMI